jgi:hypothetical protein
VTASRPHCSLEICKLGLSSCAPQRDSNCAATLEGWRSSLTGRSKCTDQLRFLVTSLLLFLAVGTPLALLKNPSDLSDEQAVTLRKLKRRGGDLWRAYEVTGALRAIIAGDLDEGDVAMMLDRSARRRHASGSSRTLWRPRPFARSQGILAAIRLAVNIARHEGFGRRVRLIINRACRFHSANAAIDLIIVTLGPVTYALARTCPGFRGPNQPISMPGPQDPRSFSLNMWTAIFPRPFQRASTGAD